MTITSHREAILNALAAALTVSLEAEYGADHVCERSFKKDLTTFGPEATPRLRINAMDRTPADSPDLPIYDLTLQVIGFIKRSDTSEALLEAEGGRLEAFLDNVLLSEGTLAGYSVSIFQRQGQASLVAADDSQCWVVYDLTLRYAEPNQ